MGAGDLRTLTAGCGSRLVPDEAAVYDRCGRPDGAGWEVGDGKKFEHEPLGRMSVNPCR